MATATTVPTDVAQLHSTFASAMAKSYSLNKSAGENVTAQSALSSLLKSDAERAMQQRLERDRQLTYKELARKEYDAAMTIQQNQANQLTEGEKRRETDKLIHEQMLLDHLSLEQYTKRIDSKNDADRSYEQKRNRNVPDLAVKDNNRFVTVIEKSILGAAIPADLGVGTSEASKITPLDALRISASHRASPVDFATSLSEDHAPPANAPMPTIRLSPKNPQHYQESLLPENPWATDVGVFRAGTEANTIPQPVLQSVSVMTIFTASGQMSSTKESDDARKSPNKTSEKEKTGTSFSTSASLVEQSPVRSTLFDVREFQPEYSLQPESVSRRMNHRKPEEQDHLPQQEKPIGTTVLHFQNVLADALSAQTQSQDVVPSSEEPESTIEIQVDRVRFVQRIAAACHSAANQNGVIRIKLNPESLGPLTIRLFSPKGSETGSSSDIRPRQPSYALQMTASNEMTRRLILNQIDELFSALGDRNISLSSFSIDCTPVMSKRHTA